LESRQAEFFFITAALSRGAVSIPDHDGLEGMWGRQGPAAIVTANMD
jgi:hypothetical protein